MSATSAWPSIPRRASARRLTEDRSSCRARPGPRSGNRHRPASAARPSGCRDALPGPRGGTARPFPPAAHRAPPARLRAADPAGCRSEAAPFDQETRRSIMTYALWIVQGLLAAVFLLSGGTKLVLPIEKLSGPVALPAWFLRFIGVAEVLGAVGLILPGLLRIRPGLKPLAAAGLVIIMIGATGITLVGGD